MTATDDGTIRSDDVVYRRIHPRQLTEDSDGAVRVSSAAFKPNRQDALALSVYLGSELDRAAVRPVDCVLPGGGHTLAALTVEQVRSLQHGVVRDPVEGAAVPNPCDPAHALITGFSSSGGERGRQARALARAARRYEAGGG